MAEGLKPYPVQLLAYQSMPNHWHLVLRPTEAEGISKFLRWMTATHTMPYHAYDHTSGERIVYQGVIQELSGPRRRSLPCCLSARRLA
ncbi:hypothetical protein Mal33_35230 [Rosistilla oblonga]|uniref:Transposase IS200-like domain-containing protein n=1 Tax=Rosistilla oblonga TaxID=2527990 RepID=A0A518IWQ5_9BACT|nr:hypothetical protein Mal33_35230 [Rosistilla oblonga]